MLCHGWPKIVFLIILKRNIKIRVIRRDSCPRVGFWHGDRAGSEGCKEVMY